VSDARRVVTYFKIHKTEVKVDVLDQCLILFVATGIINRRYLHDLLLLLVELLDRVLALGTIKLWIQPTVFSEVIFDFATFGLAPVDLIFTELIQTYFGVGLVVELLHFLHLGVVEHSK